MVKYVLEFFLYSRQTEYKMMMSKEVKWASLGSDVMEEGLGLNLLQMKYHMFFV